MREVPRAVSEERVLNRRVVVFVRKERFEAEVQAPEQEEELLRCQRRPPALYLAQMGLGHSDLFRELDLGQPPGAPLTSHNGAELFPKRG